MIIYEMLFYLSIENYAKNNIFKNVYNIPKF